MDNWLSNRNPRRRPENKRSGIDEGSTTGNNIENISLIISLLIVSVKISTRGLSGFSYALFDLLFFD